MLSFLLSVGAIYALIPIVIIIILIVAARGSLGTDFFGLFGLGTMIGFSKGVGSGGTGRGISRRTKYNTSTKKTTATSGAVGGTVLGAQTGGIAGTKFKNSKAYKLHQSLKAEETDLKFSMLGRLSRDELMTMGESVFGLGFATSMESKNDQDIITRLEKSLTLAQVKQYLKVHGLENVIKGTPTPLQAPTPGGMAAAGSMATAIPQFYKTWYHAKKGKMGREKATMAKLSEMSDEELIALCRKYNVAVSENMGRDALLNAAYMRMSSAQVNYNYDKIMKNRPGGNVSTPGASAAPSGTAGPQSPPSSEGVTLEGIPTGEMKLNILNNMSEEQMLLMLQRYGLAVPENKSRAVLQTYIYNKLTADQIRAFIEEGGK